MSVGHGRLETTRAYTRPTPTIGRRPSTYFPSTAKRGLLPLLHVSRPSDYRAFCAKGDHSSAFSSPRVAALAKVTAGLGAAALVAGGGVVVAIASTGSADPGVWGRTVSTAVASLEGQGDPWWPKLAAELGLEAEPEASSAPGMR